jgi:hypothetical protein
MRRWAAAVACAFALTGVAGCAAVPDGVDGDLTDGWAPLPTATRFQPQSGACHPDLVQNGTIDNWSPVPCAGPHLAETVAVARLTRQNQAFGECTRRATTFLGGDWRTGWVVLQPVLPSRAAWSGGARWVRCDVAETSPVDGAVVRRSGSMKGAVGAAGRLRMSCANPRIEGDSVTEMHPAACAASHTAEFAGLFATTRRTSSALTTDDLAGGCGSAIAKFAALPDDGDLASRVGWLGFPPDDAAWAMGDRAIRCFLWLNGEKMKGSYRNAGPGKLKIHYVRR